MANGMVTSQVAERFGIEDLADQADIFVERRGDAVGHRNAGAFLPTMLLGVQTEERQSSNFLAGRTDTDQPALVMRRIILTSR